jgi:hypothetical protein
MQDPDAPAGVRAKAATDVLDRTGFHAKSDLSVQVEATIIDFGAVIKQRLEGKAASLTAARMSEVGSGRMPDNDGDGIVEGEIIEDDQGRT